ncbi:calmodulin calcium-dependent NAD kinase isoform X2 [Elaeis guineensis]|uniref:calmodulin calcium-dependent NAD kinase isoform X2 n=1 Tax=Elaeis guineensis var. tenera TaxID=51953 RepID=UPI003C6D458A
MSSPFLSLFRSSSPNSSPSLAEESLIQSLSLFLDAVLKFILLHVVAVSTAGAIAAAVGYRRKKRHSATDSRLMPRLVLTDSGRVEELESFSHYVARQLGFGDVNEYPQMCKLAYNYLRKTKGCEDDIFAFFASDPNPEAVYVKFVEEMDKCILGYFAFHWDHATLMITKVLTADGEPKRKLKDMVMEATRKQRFERVTRDLKVARVFSTLVEEMKAIGIAPYDDSKCTDVMIPAAHSDRSPVLLLMGGGMGAGKSTVLKDILEQDVFWSKANAVRVEADAFKETDVIYRAISSRGHHNDMLQTAELVHQSSTDAASSLLVTALNEGRDVIMDGTLSWEPFVEQTIAMARAVHRQRYRMGVGYKVDEDGTITENYWEPVEDDDDDHDHDGSQPNKRKPYRIELIGVVCDAYLAVVRGYRRAIMINRAVRVKSQLKSHQRFASAFQGYCDLVDNAKLYSTNTLGTPKLIARKDAGTDLLVNPQEFGCVEKVSKLNAEANSIHELYPRGDTTCGSRSIWHDLVMSPSRQLIQQELKAAVQMVEEHTP